MSAREEKSSDLYFEANGSIATASASARIALVVASTVCCGILFIMMYALANPPAWFGFALLVLGPVAIGSVRIATGARSTWHEARIRLDTQGLTINDTNICSRTNFVGGTLLPVSAGTGRVRLLCRVPVSAARRSWRVQALELRLDSEESARELLSAVKTLASTTLSTALVATRGRHAALTLVVGLLFLAAVHALDLLSEPFVLPTQLLIMTLGTVIYLGAVKTTLTVGSDGVDVDRLFSRRFVAFDELVEARTSGKSLMLTLRSGRRLFLGKATAPVVNSFRDLINQRARSFPSFPIVTRKNGLDRERRSVAEWIDRLRANVMEHERGYREGALSMNDLLVTLKDRGTSGLLRTASAISLHKFGGKDAERDIRIAAADAAEPKLRVALEKIAEGADDAELERCLEDLIVDEEKMSERERRKI